MVKSWGGGKDVRKNARGELTNARYLSPECEWIRIGKHLQGDKRKSLPPAFSFLMKKIILKTGEGVLVDDCDFEWLNRWVWRKNANGYVFRRSEVGGKRKHVLIHRLILNVPEGYETDHINRNKLDNRRANLRVATRSQNRANSSTKRRINLYKGAYKIKMNGYDYYQAQLTYQGKTIHIGYFKTAIEAARAYDQKAKEIFGEFARGNFI